MDGWLTRNLDDDRRRRILLASTRVFALAPKIERKKYCADFTGARGSVLAAYFDLFTADADVPLCIHAQTWA